MTVTILEVERHPKLDMRVELRLDSTPIDPDAIFQVDAAPYAVRLVSGGDYAEEPFDNEMEARAHFRNVCQSALGITPAYTAPTFDVKLTTPSEIALDLYSRFHSRLSQAGVGSEAAKALMREMVADPAFTDHRPLIMELCGKSSDWINAVIRTACRRIGAIETAASVAEVESVPGFGMF